MQRLKKTKQREAIIEIIKNSDVPLSAEVVYEKLRSDFPKIAVSTVYRNLEKFEANCLLHREILNDGVLRFAHIEQHEHYLVCTKCKKRIPLPDCPLLEIEEILKKETGFEIEGHSLSIYGKCPECIGEYNADIF